MNQILIKPGQNSPIKTKARFLHWQNKQHFDDYDNPRNGDELEKDGTNIHFQNGFIHADNEPAIECSDGHIEFWQYGRLHRADNKPAVITDGGKCLEYWNSGKRVK